MLLYVSDGPLSERVQFFRGYPPVQPLFFFFWPKSLYYAAYTKCTGSSTAPACVGSWLRWLFLLAYCLSFLNLINTLWWLDSFAACFGPFGVVCSLILTTVLVCYHVFWLSACYNRMLGVTSCTLLTSTEIIAMPLWVYALHQVHCVQALATTLFSR